MVRPTFMIFSGLPCTGKSALADRLAGDIHWPVLRIDDLAACMPAEMNRNTFTFWDQTISALLLLADAQLKLGVSVIADSIFMNLERFHAQAIARQSGARFLPVHTFVSNETVWEQRVTARSQSSQLTDKVASWSDVQAQRQEYRPWEAGIALFVDAIQPLDTNYAAVRSCACNPEVEFQPLAEIPFTPGKYHQ